MVCNIVSFACTYVSAIQKSLLDLYCIHIALPYITVHPKPILLRTGSYIVNALSCVASGIGPFYYQWKKYDSYNDSWIKPSNRANNVTSSELIFSEVIEEDEGIYRCVVTNDEGSVLSNNATITVYGKNCIVIS